MEKGDKLMADYKYAQAIPEYKPFADQGNDKAVRAIAECYRKVNDWENAETYYAMLVSKNAVTINPKYYLYYGQALLSNGKYDEARTWLQKFIATKPEEDNALAKSLLASCDKAKENLAPRRQVKYKNLELLNTPASEFCAVRHGNLIYFSSSRQGKTDAWTGNGYLQVYIAEPLGDTAYRIEPLKGPINSKNYNSGPATIDSSGRRIYFTKNNYQYGEALTNKKGEVTLKLFGARLEKDETHDIHELELNDVEYSCAYPSVNREGNRLFFTSDRAGGYGGKDIYSSTFLGGKWGKPQNLGPKVNSAGDERFPFIAADGSLYFSSNGWAGVGGLDIFRSGLSKLGEFLTPENIGTPFNSSKDDFGFFVDADFRSGFFASDRGGGKGLDDLYAFDYDDIPLQLFFTGNNSPLSGATLSIETPGAEPVFLAVEKGQVSLVLEPDTAYTFSVSKDGFAPKTFQLKTGNDLRPLQQFITLQAAQ